MTKSWQQYQQDAAAFFRGLGLDADVDVEVTGIRTHHAVDVVVRSHHVGFNIQWLVECKLWQTPVSKLHVLALREIVADTGSDRGILLCEAGFQSGAVEASNLTNVQLTSLDKLRQTASADILAMRLRELFDRNEVCKARYWAIAKDERIARGLRPDFLEGGYSGGSVVEFTAEVLMRAFRGVYPFECVGIDSMVLSEDERRFATPLEVTERLQALVSDLERRLDTCGA